MKIWAELKWSFEKSLTSNSSKIVYSKCILDILFSDIIWLLSTFSSFVFSRNFCHTVSPKFHISFLNYQKVSFKVSASLHCPEPAGLLTVTWGAIFSFSISRNRDLPGTVPWSTIRNIFLLWWSSHCHEGQYLYRKMATVEDPEKVVTILSLNQMIGLPERFGVALTMSLGAGMLSQYIAPKGMHTVF